MKRIILCADDYGQNTVISQGIIELLKKNRLSAVSCMANAYYWLTHAKWLHPFKNEIDIGLHFNLTEGKALTKDFGDFYSLPKLIVKSYLKKLDSNLIEAELHAQLDQFIVGVGRLPDFIDGHQHIQQLPIIREAIFNVYEKRLRDSYCYLRMVNDKNFLLQFKTGGYFKFILIQLLGSYFFNKELQKRNIPHNNSFSGFYHFKNAKNYSSIFPLFLKAVNDKGLIMCHPGLAPHTDTDDKIAESRFLEYQFFQSENFRAICQEKGVILSRFEFDENTIP